MTRAIEVGLRLRRSPGTLVARPTEHHLPRFPSTLLCVAAIVAGAGMIVLGLVWLRPRPMAPTRATVGVALLVCGYHAVAYALPDSWGLLKAPRDWWWSVPAAALAAILLSAGLDRLAGRDQRDER